MQRAGRSGPGLDLVSHRLVEAFAAGCHVLLGKEYGANDFCSRHRGSRLAWQCNAHGRLPRHIQVPLIGAFPMGVAKLHGMKATDEDAVSNKLPEIVSAGVIGSRDQLLCQLATGGRDLSAVQLISSSETENVMEKCRKGQIDDALASLDDIYVRGKEVSKSVSLALVHACVKKKDLALGRRVHALILTSRYKGCEFLSHQLIRLFTICGSLHDAKQVFYKVLEPSVYTWQAIISAHMKFGEGAQAIGLYDKMRHSGLEPNDHIYCAVLQACTRISAIKHGRAIHNHMIQVGFRHSVFVGTTLVDMYAKSGNLEEARMVFDRLSQRDVVCWNAMVAGYAEHGLGKEALALYEEMLQQGVKPNSVTFVRVLKACASIHALDDGRKIHEHILNAALLDDVFVHSSLVDMYAKCGDLQEARKVFDGLSQRDVVSWNVMISGYGDHGLGREAVELYEHMHRQGVMPDSVTFVSVLKACARIRALDKGIQIHNQILKCGLLAHDPFVGNTLVDLYAKCGNLEEARKVFDGLSHQDVVTWNAMIAGYAEHGRGKEALALYEDMQNEGVIPNNVTFICLLKACASIKALHEGTQIHKQLLSRGLPQDVFVGSILVDMYAKCGNMQEAQKVFDGLSRRNVVTWNALIAGYAEHGLGREALVLYEDMKTEGLMPDRVTFLSLLRACASVGALDEGMRIHNLILNSELAEDTFVGNTLVDMYAKCGDLAKARKVFDGLSQRNVISWTAMIAGYAEHGLGKEALALYEDMLREGLMPNNVTFICLLNACSHAGLVDEGSKLFSAMSERFGITPDIEHYTCMVDLYGRAGLLHQAEAIINSLEIPHTDVLWMCMLGACRRYNNVELGTRAFDSIVQLNPGNAAAYVLLSDIYAAAGMWADQAEVRRKMRSAGIGKVPGRSWIEVENQVHTFLVEDADHPHRRKIYAKLKELA